MTLDEILTRPGTPDEIEHLTETHIATWAGRHLFGPSADAFTEWLAAEVGDWEGPTIASILYEAWRLWTGADMPTPPS